MEKIKIMIADDHKLMREILTNGLETDTIEVIGVAENGQVLIDLVKVEVPDIVVLDMSMPVLGGEEVLKIFSKDFPGIKTVILSVDYSEFMVADAIINGAAAYVKKDSFISEIIEAILSVNKEGFFFNGLFSQEILGRLKNANKIYYTIENERFSVREIEVFKQICEDIPVEQISENLNIAVSTVRYHKNNLLRKTESETTISLVKYAIKHGIFKNDKF